MCHQFFTNKANMLWLFEAPVRCLMRLRVLCFVSVTASKVNFHSLPVREPNIKHVHHIEYAESAMPCSRPVPLPLIRRLILPLVSIHTEANRQISFPPIALLYHPAYWLVIMSLLCPNVFITGLSAGTIISFRCLKESDSPQIPEFLSCSQEVEGLNPLRLTGLCCPDIDTPAARSFD